MVDAIGPKPVADKRIAAVTSVPATAPATAARAATAGNSAPGIAAQTLARSMAATPPVDADRVAQIKQAVANGTFPIYPARIADRLIALKLEWKSHDPA